MGDKAYKLRRKVRDKARRLRHKERGLCIYCSAPVEIGRWCAKHYYNSLVAGRAFYTRNKEKRAREKHNRRIAYILQRRCTECGAPLIEDEFLQCVNCLIKHQISTRQRRAN